MIEIELPTGSDAELEARDRILRLVETCDLGRWLYTDLVRIADGIVSRSHPVLTLGIQALQDDQRALATFVHEQLHWWLLSREESADAAIEETRNRWPEVPGPGEGGAASPKSTWLHLVLCPIEHLALVDLIGTARATELAEDAPAYRWVYRQVLDHWDWFTALLARHDLVPPEEPPEPQRWESARDLRPNGPVVYLTGAHPDREQRVADLIESLHRRHPSLADWQGDHEVIVHLDARPRIQPAISVDDRLLDDEPAFLAQYLRLQIAWLHGRSREARDRALAEVDPDVLAVAERHPMRGIAALGLAATRLALHRLLGADAAASAVARQGPEADLHRALEEHLPGLWELLERHRLVPST